MVHLVGDIDALSSIGFCGPTSFWGTPSQVISLDNAITLYERKSAINESIAAPPHADFMLGGGWCNPLSRVKPSGVLFKSIAEAVLSRVHNPISKLIFQCYIENSTMLPFQLILPLRSSISMPSSIYFKSSSSDVISFKKLSSCHGQLHASLLYYLRVTSRQIVDSVSSERSSRNKPE